MKHAETFLLLLSSVIITTGFSASVWANSNSVVSANINLQTVSPQSVSVQRPSAYTISAPTNGGRDILPSTSGATAYGAAQGQPVIPPAIKNTTLVKAEYLTPNPKQPDRPFIAKQAEVRLPETARGNLYWTPNQQSLIINR